MLRITILPLFIVLLLLLTGCNAFGTGNTPIEEPTVTPAPVPTEQSMLSPADIPGVTNQGVYNSSTLAFAHNTTLQNTSFTLQRNTTARYSNGTLAFRQTYTARVSENRDRFYVKFHRNWTQTSATSLPNDRSTPSIIELWSNSSQLFVRTAHKNNAEYIHTNSNNLPAILINSSLPTYSGTSMEYVAQTLNGAETRIRGSITRNETTLYRIQSTGLFVQAALVPFGAPRNATAYALVDSQGVVHRLTLTYPAKLGSSEQSVNVTYTIHFINIGSTTVERPTWFETTLKKSNSIERLH